MDANEVKDSATLERWLDNSLREDVIAIAQRAALRVFPLWGRYTTDPRAMEHGLSPLPILWSLLTSGVVRQYPTPEVLAAATASAAAAIAAANAADAVNATYAASAANAAARFDAADAARACAAARAADDYAGDADDTWVAIRGDAGLLQSGTDPSSSPLWTAHSPDWFARAEGSTRQVWSRDPHTWSFWVRWWDGMLAGKPLDWELQRDVALIPHEDWKKGPAHIAGIIRDIELRHAISATPNGESIEVNPSTGLLRLVPVSELPDDIAEYARRKMRRAAGVFGLLPGNQYTALNDDLRMLREAANDPEMTPVELFDACASASRRLAQRSALHECPQPEEDALIADYATRIREAGSDILANDPQTQAVLSKRNDVTGNYALIEGRTNILAAVQVIVVASEGRLAQTLPSIAVIATDPKVNPEDRNRAAYVLASRILRVAKIVSLAAAGTVGTAYAVVVGAKEVLEAIPAIQASPHFQQALEFVLRYLKL